MYRADGQKLDNLVVVLGGRVAGINPLTGVVVWQHQFKSSRMRIEIYRETIYVLVSDAHKVVGLKYPTGEKLFETELPGTYYSSPTMFIERQRVYVAVGGELSALTLDGELLWANEFPGWGTGAMTIANATQLRSGDY